MPDPVEILPCTPNPPVTVNAPVDEDVELVFDEIIKLFVKLPMPSLSIVKILLELVATCNKSAVCETAPTNFKGTTEAAVEFMVRFAPDVEYVKAWASSKIEEPFGLT